MEICKEKAALITDRLKAAMKLVDEAAEMARETDEDSVNRGEGEAYELFTRITSDSNNISDTISYMRNICR